MTVSETQPLPVKSTRINADGFAAYFHLVPPQNALQLNVARAWSVAEQMPDALERANIRRILHILEALPHPRLTFSPSQRLQHILEQALKLPHDVLCALIGTNRDHQLEVQSVQTHRIIVTALWVIPGLLQQVMDAHVTLLGTTAS